MNKIVSWVTDEAPKYWKVIVSTVPMVLYVGTELVQDLHVAGADGKLDVTDVYKVAVLVATSYAVYKKANRSPASPAQTG